MNKYLQVHNFFIRTIEKRNTGTEIIQTSKGLFNIDSDRKPYRFSFFTQLLLTCFVSSLLLMPLTSKAQIATCGSGDKNDACANANGGVYPVWPDFNLTSASGTYAIGTWYAITFSLGSAGQPRFDFYADAGTIVDFATTTGQDAEVNISRYNTTTDLLRQDDDVETSFSGYPTSNANDETVSYLCPATSWFSIKLSIDNCGNIGTGTKYLFFRIRHRPCAGSTSYGSGVWNGYVYDGTGPNYFYGSIGTQTANNINVDWGTGQPIGSGCGNMCDVDNFSTEWFMNQTYSDGVYVFSTPGNDDGRVLSSNGASSWNLINDWGASSGTTTTPPTAMNGNYNMVFYQRENSGGAKASLTTCQMSGGNLNVYGSGNWRVYDYASNDYGFATSNYRGTFTTGTANATSASFGAISNGTVASSSNAAGGQCGYTGSGQSIRALITNNFTAGAYSVTIGADDNYRIDFGSGTFPISGGCCAGVTSTVNLNGSTNIQYQGNNGGGGGASYSASITCLSAVAGTLSVSQTCGSSSGTLTLNSSRGYIQWQTSTDGSTWNNSGGLVTSNTLSVSPGTTTFYKAQVWSCGSSVTSNVVAVTSGSISGNVVVADNVTMGGTINVSGNFTLNATKTITVQQGCPLVINATNITINGTINADGAGYAGGSGGNGGAVYGDCSNEGDNGYSGGKGFKGNNGIGTGGGVAGTDDAEAMANNLQKNGAFVPNVRPGAPTAEYVATILSRTTFFGAVFFSIIAVMPFILQRMTGNALFAIGGTAILIAVSVSTDLIKKLSAQASMKEY
jgi:hypothetical protein